ADGIAKAPGSDVWKVDEQRLLPTGELVPPPPERDLSRGVPLGDQEYDDFYTGLNRHGRSEAVYADPGTGVEIAVISDEAFREFVIYAPLDRDVVRSEERRVGKECRAPGAAAGDSKQETIGAPRSATERRRARDSGTGRAC